MSVSNQETVFQYVGNGVTTAFPYACQVQLAGDLDVYLDDAPIISGFTVSGIGAPTGGSVTFGVAPASGAAVRIERVVDLARSTDYQQNGDFLSRVVNPDFDRLWMALQQFRSGLARALHFPKSDVNPVTELPPAAARANNLLGFDSAGNPTTVAPAAQSATALQFLYATSAGASLIGWIRASAGAVATTIAKWMGWQPANIFDYMTDAEIADVQAGTLSLDVTAAVQAALDNNREVHVSANCKALISGIVIPNHTKLVMHGGIGNSTTSRPSSYFVKKASATGIGINIQNTGWLDGGGLYCQPGNTGNGIQLVSNSSRATNAYCEGAGSDGFRVGIDPGSNANSWLLRGCLSLSNGRYGFYVHDGKATEGADTNAGILDSCIAIGNASDGFRLGHTFWNTVINCLSEINGGWGLYISPTLNNGTPEARYHTIIGGDYNESNTLGSVKCSGYACSIYHPDPNQIMVVDGPLCNHFGNGSTSKIQGIDLAGGRLKFPAPATPSSDPNTIDDYQEETFTATATGMTTSPTGGATYTKIGNIVVLEIPTVTGTSNSTSFTLTGMPAEIRPSSTKAFLIRTQNNGGAVAITNGSIDTGGLIILANNLTGAGGSWTAAGTKGVFLHTLSYTV